MVTGRAKFNNRGKNNNNKKKWCEKGFLFFLTSYFPGMYLNAFQPFIPRSRGYNNAFKCVILCNKTPAINGRLSI